MTGLFVGIDLGGSGTRAVLADAQGSVLASGVGPPAGHLMGGAGRRRLTRALATALAGMEPLTRGAAECSIWAGSTGLSIPGRREWLEVDLTTRFPGARVDVSNDAHTAVWGGLGDGPGVAVLAGTGSIAMARDADSRLARAGGWGYLLGDEGSGYWLGREALRATLRVYDGAAADGVLSKLVREALRSRSGPDVIAWATSDDHTRRVADLAPLVSAAANAGDPAAIVILRGAAIALAAIGQTAARALALREPVRVVPVGGVWKVGASLRDAFAAAWPSARIQEPMLRPVFGAVLLAMRSASPEVVERLRAANRTVSSAW